MRKRPYILRRPGGEIDRRRIFNSPGIVLFVAALNVAAFALVLFMPQSVIRVIVDAAAVSPVRFIQGLREGDGALSVFPPLITHMFVHAGFAHLLINTFFFLALGSPVARRMGAANALRSFRALFAALLFLTFYLLSGVFGALAYIAGHAAEHSLLVGASGGVSGLLGAVARFAFNRSTLFGPEHAKFSPLTSANVIGLSAIIVLTNVAFGLFGGAATGGADIAWEAHLGGYFFGLVFYPLFERAAGGGR